MIAPVFNAVLTRRDASARFAASSAALPTSFAQILAERRSLAAATSSASSLGDDAVAASAARTTDRAGADGFPATASPWLRTAARRDLAASIQRTAADAGVAPELALAVAIAESSLDASARSADGLSEGTFQVTRSTAAQLARHFDSGAAERPEGPDDVALGVAYLRYLQDLFGRGAPLGGGLRAEAVADSDERRRFAVAAYNAGEGRVAAAQRRAGERGGEPTSFDDVRPFLPPITRRYVDRVMTVAGADEAPPTLET